MIQNTTLRFEKREKRGENLGSVGCGERREKNGGERCGKNGGERCGKNGGERRGKNGGERREKNGGRKAWKKTVGGVVGVR